jgi:hypothetical protein
MEKPRRAFMHKLLASIFIGKVLTMTNNAAAQGLPFSIEADGKGHTSFSNFRMGKTVQRGIPIDELRFDVKVERAQCRNIAIYYTVITKSGAFLKKGVWHQQFNNVTSGEAYVGRIGDITFEWGQVRLIQIWPQCHV